MTSRRSCDVRLRARGRQLGDTLHNSGAQDIEHLVREMAYEHWHRMLFARYLAANNLLMHPELNVPVTLADCEELADEEGARDGFALAARYATDMLPQIFREGDPVLEVEMAPEHRNKLQRLVEGLPQPVFEADDSLGWVYQFWQAKRKDEVNASGDKIGADELPAVTQLFTEHYMVQFLLDNTLGAWWTARHPDTDLSFEYLRFVEDEETGEEVPAAGHVRRLAGRGGGAYGDGPVHGLGALPRGRAADARPHADARRRALGPRRRGCRAARQPARPGDRRALHADCGVCAGAGGVDVSRRGGGSRPAGDEPGLQRPRARRRLREWEQLAGDDERLQNGMRRLYTLFQDAPHAGEPHRSRGAGE